MKRDETDKQAGHLQSLTPRNPLLTVDIIIECDGGIVLIERKNPPHGWALPGGRRLCGLSKPFFY